MLDEYSRQRARRSTSRPTSPSTARSIPSVGIRLKGNSTLRADLATAGPVARRVRRCRRRPGAGGGAPAVAGGGGGFGRGLTALSSQGRGARGAALADQLRRVRRGPPLPGPPRSSRCGCRAGPAPTAQRGRRPELGRPCRGADPAVRVLVVHGQRPADHGPPDRRSTPTRTSPTRSAPACSTSRWPRAVHLPGRGPDRVRGRLQADQQEGQPGPAARHRPDPMGQQGHRRRVRRPPGRPRRRRVVRPLHRAAEPAAQLRRHGRPRPQLLPVVRP